MVKYTLLIFLGLVNTLFSIQLCFGQCSLIQSAFCIHVVAVLTRIAAWPMLPACACQEPGMIARICSWGQLHFPHSCVLVHFSWHSHSRNITDIVQLLT